MTKKSKSPQITPVNQNIINTLIAKVRSTSAPNSQPIQKNYLKHTKKFIKPQAAAGASSQEEFIMYVGELKENEYKSADSLGDKNDLVIKNMSETMKLDKDKIEQIIEFNNSETGGGTEIFNNQIIHFAKKPLGFSNEKDKRIYYVIIPIVVFRLVFPQSVTVSPSSKKNKKTSTKADEWSWLSASIEKGMPAKFNFSFPDNAGDRNALIRIGDIPLYTSVANAILKDLANKIKENNVVLDNPINLGLQAVKIQRLYTEITSILSESGNAKYSSEDYIKFKFTSLYGIKALYLIPSTKDNTGGGPAKEAAAQLTPTSFFNNQTLNSIIYNLVVMYNRFGRKVRQNAFSYEVQNSVFYTEESIRYFIDSYIYPKTSLVYSPITRGIIEKFIIGDVRLLDDKVYKQSFMDPTQIPDGVRGNLQKEMSQGYEKIGDLLGESWLTGKFESIDNVRDFRKQLLKYIDMEELISIAVTCLLKIIPLDEALDYVCEPILEEFDKHKESIIQELDKMDDGIAKNLAKELKEIYFNKVLGKQGILGQIENEVEGYVQNLPQAMQDASTIHSWRDKNAINLQTYIDMVNANYFLLQRAMTDDETNLPLLGPSDWNENNSIERTFVYSGLSQRQQRLKERLDDIIKESEKISKQLAIFNGVNEPENLKSLESYYATERVKLKQKLDAANNGIFLGQELQTLYQSVLRDIIPNLIILDPYIKDKTKKIGLTLSGVPYLAQKNISLENINEIQYLKSIKELNNITFPTINNNNPIFTFSPNPNTQNKVFPTKTEYDFQLQNGFKSIIDRIQQLERSEDSPFNILSDLENIGVGVVDKTIEGIIGDPSKRRVLCLSIISAVPAAAYGLYLLFKNIDETSEFLKNESLAITKAIERKIEIFSRADYPILDILEEFVDSLKQIGLNFARDLIINGIMWVLGELKKACSDEEIVNAPFSPLGAIDLSDFMSTSEKGANGLTIGNLDNSDTFKSLSSIDSELTERQLNSILKALSAGLTINEIAALLDGSASDNLYMKSISIMNDLVPDVIKINSAFYKYYVNESGIIEFFNILSRDIEPAKIARAKREYRLGKRKILEICLGNDYSLFGDLDNEDLRQALANNYPTVNLPEMFNALDDMMGENKVPEPCEVGISTLTDSQKFTARQASEAIYGNIENRFNQTVLFSKDLFIDRYLSFSEFTKNLPNVENSNNAKSFFDFTQENKNSINDFVDFHLAPEFVATPLRGTLASINNITGLGQPNATEFKYVSTSDGERTIALEFGPYQYNMFLSEKTNPAEFNIDTKQLRFDFNFDQNRLLLEYGIVQNDENPDQSDGTTTGIENSYAVVEYDKYNYLPTGSDGAIIEPYKRLFGNKNNSNIQGNGIIYHPDYSQTIKNSLSDLLIDNGEEQYLLMMNQIFKDLVDYSIKSGLFKVSNFKSLDLNKHITPAKINLGDGTPPVDACFLGFANKEVLHRQTESIANILACRNNSATKTPFNMGYIKILFDCFVRAMTMKDMMKSFFVMGMFPQDLLFDEITPDNFSVFEELIKANIFNTIKNFSPVSAKSIGKDSIYYYDTFYNNIFKQFVVDMSKIIFKNDNLTEKQAFDFAINAQIQFIKNQFKKAYTNAFGSSDSIIGLTEYQLLTKKIIDDVSMSIDDDVLDLSEEFTYNEKIRALENSTLSKYFDGTVNRIPRYTADSDAEDFNFGTMRTYFGGQEILPRKNETEEQSGFQVEEENYLIDIDSRIPFFDILSTNTTPTNGGFVLDKYIELKGNSDVFSDREIIEISNVLLRFGKIIYNQLNSNNEQIKNIFSATGLFLLIPQAINFIVGDEAKNNRDAYRAAFPSEPFSGGAGMDYRLFYWLFRYNYDPDFFGQAQISPEGQVEALSGFNWYQRMNNKGLWQKLNHSLTGKTRLGTLYSIIDLLPTPPTGITNTTILYNSVFQNISSTTEEINNSFLTSFIDKLLADKNPRLRENGAPKEFFNWLFSKKVNDVLGFNTVLRIDLKIEDSDLEFTKNFISKLLDDTVRATDIRRQKSLLEEKIGPQRLGSLNSSGANVFFSLPVFEIKQPLPNDIDWLTFFMIPDKDSYFEDGFYNIFNINDETTSADVTEKITSASDINNFLFSKDHNDFVSYFYKLRTFSATSQNKDQVLSKEQMLSTFWWNIKGRPVTLAAILRAVYLDNAEDDKYVSPLSDPIPYSEIREALTPISLKSFLSPFEEVISDDPLDTSFGNYTSLKADINQKQRVPGRGEDQGVLYLSRPPGNVGKFSQKLSSIEKIKLVDNEIGDILANPSGISKSQYKVSYDEESGIFKEGYRPFIAIREFDDSVDGPNWKKRVDWGFIYSSRIIGGEARYGGLPQQMMDQYPGTDVDEAFLYMKSVETGHAPMGLDRIGQVPWDGHIIYGTGKGIDWVAEPYGASFKEIVGPVEDDDPQEISIMGTYVKGGLGYKEKQFIEKPITGNVLNIYDLFSKTLKKQNDKEQFNELLNLFFLKEQTTIIALIHRIITEREYPRISTIYDQLATDCFKTLAKAVAIANGDHEITQDEENERRDLEDTIKEIAKIIGESFLKAVATTVDPTWQTDWFAPGPLTPFGFAAKLLGEDFSSKNQNGRGVEFPPGEEVCDDSLRQSTNFLQEFTETWRESLGGSASDEQQNNNDSEE